MSLLLVDGRPQLRDRLQQLGDHLLEDDGITDIHGSIATYSYAPVSTVPEPAPAGLLACALAILAAAARSSRSRNRL